MQASFLQLSKSSGRKKALERKERGFVSYPQLPRPESLNFQSYHCNRTGAAARLHGTLHELPVPALGQGHYQVIAESLGTWTELAGEPGHFICE